MEVNQVFDIIDVGIPSDFDIALARTKAYAEQAGVDAARAEAAAEDAETSAAESAASADAAALAAQQAQAWGQATSSGGITIGPNEPPGASAGAIWFQTDQDAPGTIVAIKVYGGGGALYPSPITFPSSTAFPGSSGGSWTEYTFGTSATAANLVTLGTAEPTSAGSDGDVYVNMTTGEAYLMQ